VAPKVGEADIFSLTKTTIGLDHEYLSGSLSVYVLVGNVGNVNICTQRAQHTAARVVAVHRFNEDVMRWALFSDALVTVRDFDIVDPNAIALDVDTIKTALFTAMDDEVVYLSACAGVHREMKRGS